MNIVQRFSKWSIAGLGLLAAVGCHVFYTPGNGVIREEAQPCPDGVNTLTVNGSWQVTIHGGAPDNRCVVRTDENLFEFLTVTYENGHLSAVRRGNAAPTDGFRLDLYTTTGPENISFAGSGDYRLEHLEQPRLQLCGSGSADLTMTDCTLQQLTMTSNGSGDRSLIRCRLDSAVVVTSGSGDLRLLDCQATDLKYSGNGSGNTELNGRFGHVNLNKNGSGHLGVAQAESIELAKSGSGDTERTATGAIRGHASGSGDVVCHGTPTVAIQKSGSGQLLVR